MTGPPDYDKFGFLRRQPSARVELVEGAGHSMKGDRPVEVAALIAEFIETDVSSIE